MTRVIFKYELPCFASGQPPYAVAHPPENRFELALPRGARPFSFGIQPSRSNAFQLWALVDLDEERSELREFVFVGTGHPVPDGVGYQPIGSWITDGLVFHLLEVVR